MLKFLGIKKTVRCILDIIYPKFCRLCSAVIDDSSFDCVCKQCFSTTKTNLPPFCKLCGSPLNYPHSDKATCLFCRGKKFNFDEAFSVCEYAGRIKTCLKLFKYQGKFRLGENLAELMAAFLSKNCNIKGIDLIACVPLHRSKMLNRGFNQAEILAKLLGEKLNITCSLEKLKRIKMTNSQFNLDLKQRRENISGAFTCTDPDFFAGRSVLLVDDIFTTGATLNECAKVLKQAGASRVTVFTMAR